MILSVTDCEEQVTQHQIYSASDFPLLKIMSGVTVSQQKRGRYYEIPCAFDIETTNYRIDDKTHFSYMYHWQFCIDTTVVFGRTWEEFQTLINRLSTYANGVINFVVYVHNLSFEWQFFHQFLKVTDIFARKKRVPLYFRTPGIEWRCSYFLSNMSLGLFTSSTPGVRYWKKTDTYDYKKLRTSQTVLTQTELEYCFCDVYGLCECIRSRMKDDTLATIPLTSTGYVRRESRERMKSNPSNHNLMKRIRLTPETYQLCQEAFRGGDTSANGIWANQVLDGIESYDMQSSYPAIMVSEKFPMSPFKRLESLTRERFYSYLNKYACLIRVVLTNVQLKDKKTIPYLDKAHCRHQKGLKSFNGRVISADRLEVTFTDIDWKIFSREYAYDTENIRVLDFYYARYGYLADELRKYVIELFRGKCELKYQTSIEGHDTQLDELYAKYKNLINALFGMLVTDICSPDIIFEDETWDTESIDTAQALIEYYNSRNSFLSYQWGIWVTAHGRLRLREGIWACGNDVIYVDTDSVKAFPGYKEAFEKLSAKNIQKLLSCGLDSVPIVNGKPYYLGEWEYEGKHGGINKFRTCGAKKYCTVYHDGTLEITVAGCNKKKGSEYLKKNGGIEAFVPREGKKGERGLLIPKEYSGRTTAWYVDDDIHTIEIDGAEMTTASSIYMEDTTYELGLTDEYVSYVSQLPYSYFLVN